MNKQKMADQLKTYLGIDDLVKQNQELWEEVRKSKVKVEEMEKEFWKHRLILKRKVTTKCDKCKKNLTLWPFETEAYYNRDGKQWHTKCYNG